MPASSLVLAQCVLCYTSAAAAKANAIHALRSGILVLGIPAIGLFVGILVFAARRGNMFARVADSVRGRD